MEKSITNASQWSEHAKAYNSASAALTTPWAVDSLSIARNEIAKKLQQHEAEPSTTHFHFLDVGSGPGVLSFEFARRYLSAPIEVRITASDLSEGMLQQLNENLTKDPTLNPLASKFTALQSDAMVLQEVPDSSVDVVGSNFGLGIFPDRAKGWATARRVLRGDGLLVATAWSAKSSELAWFDKLTDLYNAAEGDGEMLGHPSVIVGTDQEKITKELQAAGFRNIETYRTTHTVVINNPNAMIHASLNNPVAATYLERLTNEKMTETLTELMEKDNREHFYQEGAGKSDNTDPFADGRPRLVSLTAFTVLARK